MKCKRIFFVWTCFILVLVIGCAKKNDFPVLKGRYLGQKPPGMMPVIFAPGIVSTEKDEINAVFSPDGREFYFSRDTYKNVSKAGRDYTILFMKEGKNGWTTPRVVPFAGEYMNGDMFITFNNQFLFYCSDRPLEKDGLRKGDADIWMVERMSENWTEPMNLGRNINSEEGDWYPTQTKEGWLYFSSSRDGGFGGSDIYRSRFENGGFQQAVNIGAPVNSKFNEGDIFIAPDEKYLIIVSINRPGGLGSGDLYIAFRNPDGSWNEPQNMGNPVNSDSLEYCPMVSPDGKYLFFTSRRRGNDDIYWVDAKIIEKLRLRELPNQ